MDVLFSDLDNTLIYSHNKTIKQDKVVAEYLNGRVQSYITEKTYSFFCNNNWLDVIPVTTRTEEQYRRLIILDSLNIRYALVCNGGKLLIDGIEDKKWTDCSIEEASIYQDEFNECVAYLEKIIGHHRIHYPEVYMCYVKVTDSTGLHKLLDENCSCKNINIYHDNRKVYLFPKSITKGNAVQRFLNTYSIGISIGAGDDIMDVSFLDIVNYPFVGPRISEKVNCLNKRICSRSLISDELCDYVDEIYCEKKRKKNDN